jgi:hypothetical protein
MMNCGEYELGITMGCRDSLDLHFGRTVDEDGVLRARWNPSLFSLHEQKERAQDYSQHH